MITGKTLNGFCDMNKNFKGKTQCIILFSSANQSRGSVTKSGNTFDLQHALSEKEMVHEELFEDIWEDLRGEWLPCLKTDILSSAFVTADTQ